MVIKFSWLQDKFGLISQQQDGNNVLSLRVVNLSYPTYGFVTIVVPNKDMYTILDETIPLEDLPDMDVKYDGDGNVVSDFEYHGGNIGSQASQILSIQQRAIQRRRQEKYDKALLEAGGDARRVHWDGETPYLITTEKADVIEKTQREYREKQEKLQAKKKKVGAKRVTLTASDGNTVSVSSPSDAGYIYGTFKISSPVIGAEEFTEMVLKPKKVGQLIVDEVATKPEEEDEDKESEPA